MFSWLKKIHEKIKDLNISVDQYKKETDNQVIPSLAYVNRAKKLIDKNEYLEARDVLLEALEINQKDSIVLKYLGIVEEKLGNFDEAISLYKKSSELNPQDKNIWYRLGMTQVTIKKYEDAELSFEKADKISQINTDIQTGWGMALFKQRKYEQAHEKFISAIKINRYNFSAMLLAAITEIRLGKYDDAENKLSFLNNANPNESCTYEYANLYYIKGDYDLAIKYALRSIEFNNNMLPSYLLLGKLYSIKFDYDNAVNCFQSAENRDLKSPILYVEWGNALVRLYKFDEARLIYQKALYMDVECSEAQAGMALCSAEMNDFERAKNLVELLEEKGFDNVFVVEAKGLLAFNQGDVNAAINLFKTVLKNTSGNTYDYLRLARCYLVSQNDNMIRDSYEKFIKLNSKYCPVYLEYAKYLVSKNDFKDAQRKLRKALTIENNNNEILNLLFYVSYVLVKENVSEYNVKEAISIANRTNNFEYSDYKADLDRILKEINENK